MSDTAKQIENIDNLTKEQMDAWMEGVFQEFDWINKDKQRIVDALKEVQEKLRPYEDEYYLLLETHQKDSDRAQELREKIQLLQAKLKELYEMYKK